MSKEKLSSALETSRLRLYRRSRCKLFDVKFPVRNNRLWGFDKRHHLAYLFVFFRNLTLFEQRDLPCLSPVRQNFSVI